MKKIVFALLATLAAFLSLALLSAVAVATASAQTPSNSIIVDVASFRPVQSDALTGIAIDPIGLDGSKRPCTRLKMRINRMTREEIGELSFRLRGGVIDLRKQIVAHEGNGLIIEMTAHKNTVFYLQHPRFGVSNEVTISTEGNKEYYIEASLNQLYPITVQSNVPDVEVYIDGALVGRTNAECVLSVADVLPGQHRLKLVYGSSVKEQTVEVHRNSTFFHQEVDAMGVMPQDVIFQVTPATAVVTFDGEILSLDEGGAAFRTKRQGRYSYSVEAQDYHAESGQIVVGGDKVVKRITLRPAFGWLQVSGGATLSGAKVYVDNRLVGTVPFSERVRLSSGTHAVRVVKEKYKAYTSQVTITDNQTSTLTPSLAANFAVVSLTVADGAEIWINNERKGSGSWRGELALGTYRVETRKSGHRTSVESLDVATAAPINRTLTAPSPIYGSLRIVSQPLMASVKVDGRAVGETPSTLSNLLIGQHTVEVSKAGYATYKKSVTITEGQTASLNATLTKTVATSTSSSGNAPTSAGGGVPDFCEMVFVKGGTFTMGATSEQGSDAYDDEKPTHSVTVSDFYIGKYEVTQAQWEAIMGNNPSKRIGNDLPVENVSWNDVQTFIQKLNQKTGRKYRLPTEAEWEYAARGGANSKGYKYSGSNTLTDVAWYGDNSGSKTHPVGQKRPNELGIYDMSGNVYEWCQDWYSSSYYTSSPQTNPTGPSSGSNRVLRGGSWSGSAGHCRVSFRSYYTPSNRYSTYGFRLVLDSSAKSATTTSTTRATSTNSTTQNTYKVGGGVPDFCEMVFVEGGTFTMGGTSEQGSDAYDDEKPTHSVTVSDFYIGKYEVTQAQWKAIMGSNPSYFKGDNLPVENVSWDDIQTFIQKLNAKTGRKYRLPTEAEWEYAARGGANSKGYKYSGSNTLTDVAWYGDNSGSKTHPVGQKRPNELGIYDMSGNVYEWCQDWYSSSYYTSSPQTNPTGPSSGSYRVLRGDSWSHSARLCRVSYRGSSTPSYGGSGIGFRLVLLP